MLLMETPGKIANALKRVKAIADLQSTTILKSTDMNRPDREILQKTGWLFEIMKGWYILSRPDIASGDSAAWYSNFWDFLRIYLYDRFGKNYCLSAESSLELQIGAPLIPEQVIVIANQGGGIQSLPFKTSILIYADTKNLPKTRDEINGLQVMPLAFALCKISPTYYRKSSQNVEIAIRSLRSPSDLTRVILQHEFQSAASRIIGCYQFLGFEKEALEIKNDLTRAGMLVKAVNPFTNATPHLKIRQFRSPYAARVELMWHQYREVVIKLFPKERGLPKNPTKYLADVSELYEYDAYHSLSIEGYQVTKDLIEKVQKNSWNPMLHLEDEKERNALAARGYYEAFLSVQKSLTKILNGQLPGKRLEKDLPIWYQSLFAPSVRAGVISHAALVGYRNDRVFIKNSRHVPPPASAVLDSMEAFFKCLQSEKVASVRAILGHYIFVFIHPFMDGNGRIARFILNTMLASGGYPWSIVEMQRRKEYINALETAHTKLDIGPFVRFIVEEMKVSKKLVK